MWLLALWVALVARNAAAGYCATNTFAAAQSPNAMQFTKEPVPYEYGFEDAFKSIHCCVKGYRSIEWSGSEYRTALKRKSEHGWFDLSDSEDCERSSPSASKPIKKGKVRSKPRSEPPKIAQHNPTHEFDEDNRFKNGVAYPWSAGVSNLILYPEAANQTLYTSRAARSDSGNYTCRLSNETHSQTHTVELNILEKPTDAPKTMFISKDQWVAEGGRLRLFCEALIGRSYLADARSDLSWYKVWPNGTEGPLLGSQTEVKTVRDDVKDIIGSYLMVQRVSAQDYGPYVCAIHSNDYVSRNYVTVHYINGDISGFDGSWSGSDSVPWRLLALGCAAAVLLVVSAAVFHRRCTPRLVLAARQARARATPAHAARVLEKEFDVLVCWTAVDGELVRGALLPTLALKYKYRALPTPLPTEPDAWFNTLAGHASRCRSLVAVLSPAQYSPRQLLTALQQLKALPLPPVVVLLQDLPNLKREAKDSGSSLVAVLRRTRLVPWRHVHERDFWTQLRLALPLPPPRPAREIKVDSTETCDSKTSRSGSMTALV